MSAEGIFGGKHAFFACQAGVAYRATMVIRRGYVVLRGSPG
jgi:hypothetical protein